MHSLVVVGVIFLKLLQQLVLPIKDVIVQFYNPHLGLPGFLFGDQFLSLPTGLCSGLESFFLGQLVWRYSRPILQKGICSCVNEIISEGNLNILCKCYYNLVIIQFIEIMVGYLWWD